MVLVLYQLLKNKNPSPLFAARTLLAMGLLFNVWTLACWVPTWWVRRVLSFFHAEQHDGWLFSYGSFFAAFAICFVLTRRVTHPGRLRPREDTLEKGKWATGLYLTLSFAAFFLSL